jgi:hypothetical protein
LWILVADDLFFSCSFFFRSTLGDLWEPPGEALDFSHMPATMNKIAMMTNFMAAPWQVGLMATAFKKIGF